MLKAIISGNLDERSLRYYIAANWVLLGLMVAVATVVSSSNMAMGILLGGVIINLNSMGLKRDCRRMLHYHSMAVYYVGLAVRLGLVLLTVLLALLLFPENFSPMGLFVGFSVGIINFYIWVLAMVIHRVCAKEAV